MGEWPVHEKVFPFVCENDSCNKEFDQNEFIVAAHTEHVRLTNEEFTFLGLVCPKCHHFTMRKYPYDAIKSENLPDFGQLRCVPFPIDLSVKLSEKSNDLSFSPPSHIPLLNLSPTHVPSLEGDIKYPKWFLEQCRYVFNDLDIEKLVAYENEHRIKVFPRIVEPTSVYCKTDILLSNIVVDRFPEKETSIILRDRDPAWYQVVEIAKYHYLFGAETNIAEAEYKDLSIDFIVEPNYVDDPLPILQNLLQEYLQKRNNFNFDKIWKTDFLDKYIKQLFYHEGYFESPQYYQDKWYYEDIFGKVFKGPYKKIDESQILEILISDDVAGILNIDPIKLAGLISNLGLPAYNLDWTYYDPKSQSAQNAQLSPDKFIFLRSDVSEFMMKYPKLFGCTQESKVEPTKDSQVVEYARIKLEESKLDASIEAAVQIGLVCAKEKRVFDSKNLIAHLDQISPGIPVATIMAIWKAMPDDCKQDEFDIGSAELTHRKNTEYQDHLTEELSPNQKRELPLKQNKVDARFKTIQVALKLSMELQNSNVQMKREDLLSRIDQISNNKITSSNSNLIIKMIPQEFRYQPGNPLKKKNNNGGNQP